MGEEREVGTDDQFEVSGVGSRERRGVGGGN
jgi:hypothetical protein